jgi:ubiquinone/menaquinone biosynthesis C-methylase UbiE
MTEVNARFAGSVPEAYHAHLGPMFFAPYAADLAKRLKLPRASAVLEIAAGTGIVTRRLLDTLESDARLVASDLNQGMMAVARQNIAVDPRLRWVTADAGSLPFRDAGFEAVVCQFGLMFFPDKVGALREMRRVLKPRGALLLNVWGSLVDNPIARLAHETVAQFFPVDPPQFFTIPFGLHDQTMVEQMLLDAGFTSIEGRTVDITGESASAASAAKGLVCGTPILNAIQERGTVTAEVITEAVAACLAGNGGAAPMRMQMRALVFRAA